MAMGRRSEGGLHCKRIGGLCNSHVKSLRIHPSERETQTQTERKKEERENLKAVAIPSAG